MLRGIPVVRVSFAVSLALDGQILILQKIDWILQLKRSAQDWYQWLAGKIELAVDIVGAVGFEEGELRVDQQRSSLIQKQSLTCTLLAVVCDGGFQFTT